MHVLIEESSTLVGSKAVLYYASVEPSALVGSKIVKYQDI